MKTECFSLNGVLMETTCLRCEGDGVVVHPEWDDFYAIYPPETFDAVRIKYGSIEEMPGCPGLDINEEIDCSDCRGRGTLLTDDGKQFMDFVRRHI